jgi:hypothetical protein
MIVIDKSATHTGRIKSASACVVCSATLINILRQQMSVLRRYSVGSSLAGPGPGLRSNLGCRALPDGLIGWFPFRNEGRVV